MEKAYEFYCETCKCKKLQLTKPRRVVTSENWFFHFTQILLGCYMGVRLVCDKCVNKAIEEIQ